MAITKIVTPELFDFSATNTALQLPTGDTASRPATPSTGEWRFNSQLKYVEYYDGGAWRQIDTEVVAPTFTAAANFNTNSYFGNGATQKIDAKFNEAANFNGINSSITIPTPISGTTNVDFSVSLWFKPIKQIISGTYNHILGQSGDTQRGPISIILTGTSANIATIDLWRNFNGRLNTSTGYSATFTVGVWANIVVSYVATGTSDGDYITYLNGSSLGSKAISFVVPQVISSNLIFGRYNNSFWMDAAIDQARIFNTALDAAQAEDLWTDETTTTAATLDFPSGAGCIAAYQFDGNGNDISNTYNGTTSNIEYTGLQFQPDLVWVKNRKVAGNAHELADSLRGSTFPTINSNSSNAQYTNANYQFKSLDTNGFTVADDTAGNYAVNGNYTGAAPNAYAAWCWKAGGASTLNQEGNVDTQVSVNEDAGFSIAVSNQVTNVVKTFGHGLSVAPELILLKTMDSNQNWLVYTATTGTGRYLNLNTTNALTAAGAYPDIFKSVSNTTIETKFDAGDTKLVFYCFKSIALYQKIDSYTGDGSLDGSKAINVGFQPRFVLIKSTGTLGEWLLWDNKRIIGGNYMGLYPNNNLIESSWGNATFNITSTGFTVGRAANADTYDNNDSGEIYIYLAIA